MHSRKAPDLVAPDGLTRRRRHLAPFAAIALVACVALSQGCATDGPHAAFKLTPAGRTSEIVISTGTAIGDMRLWVPEGIMSNTGVCAVYPVGSEWTREGPALVQHVDEAGNVGPGNFQRIDEHTFECAGIRMPADSPVRWKTTVTAGRDDVRFSIRLTNAGDRVIEKAGAAICLKFFRAPWWADEHVFVRSGGKTRSLAELGRHAGPDNGFEAYLLRGASFDNVFYHQFWGFNRNRLDAPVMISEHRAANLCVGITGRKAYFLHSNKGNPCTDIMLALGTIRPGRTAETTGRVWIAPKPEPD